MVRFLKYILYSFLAIFFLSVMYVLIFDSDNNDSVIQQEDNIPENFSQIQDWCFDNNMSLEHLSKYPSFDTKTRDFKEFGRDDYYLYSKKLNVEIRIKEGICESVNIGSKWLDAAPSN